MRQRRLAVESLESRRVMAGNVSASIVNGELRVVGDGAANWVQIAEFPGADHSGRTFQIVGRPFDGIFNAAGAPLAGAAATKINGGTAPILLVATGDIVRVATGAGNDAVFVGNATSDMTTKGLSIDTGAGQDYARVQRVTNTSASPLTIKMTQAAGTAADAEVDVDTLFLATVTAVNSPLSISTGGGNDLITANLVTAFTGTTNVNTGAGADRINAVDIDVSGLNLNMGTSNHRDVVNVSQLESGPTTVLLGGGDDLLNITSPAFISGGITINGGAGTDELRLSPGTNEIDSITYISVEIKPS